MVEGSSEGGSERSTDTALDINIHKEQTTKPKQTKRAGREMDAWTQKKNTPPQKKKVEKLVKRKKKEKQKYRNIRKGNVECCTQNRITVSKIVDILSWVKYDVFFFSCAGS